jgi:tetratricopeptide (TPR) repeat protein
MEVAFQALGGSHGDPVARWKMIIEKNPDLGAAHFALAQVYFEQQKFPEAEAEFKKVIDLQPKNKQDLTGNAHYGIAMALAMQNRDQDAISEFKAAIKDGSDMSGVYFEMGNSYAKLKMYDDAISAYLKEKEKNGDNPDLENALAETYQAKGMTKEAQDARNQATQLKSEEKPQ